jgi:hypothetical protein
VSSSAGDPTIPQLVSVRDDDVACGDDSQFKVLITVHLWSTWLEVAVEQAEEARRARDEMTRLRSEGKEFAVQLGSEFRASVVAVAASAHALDALYGSTVIPGAPGDTARTAQVRSEKPLSGYSTLAG